MKDPFFDSVSLSSIIAAVVLTIVSVRIYDYLFGKFGRFTSSLKLVKTIRINDSKVFIVQLRSGAEHSVDGLKEAFRSARVTDPKINTMRRLMLSHELLPTTTTSAEVDSGHLFSIHVGHQPPHACSQCSCRTFDRYDNFACIDIETVEISEHETDPRPWRASQSKLLPGRVPAHLS